MLASAPIASQAAACSSFSSAARRLRSRNCRSEKWALTTAAAPRHLAFSISAEDLPAWEKLLAEKGVAIESRVCWPRGGTSLYFRDPDNHLVELATPGVWSIY